MKKAIQRSVFRPSLRSLEYPSEIRYGLSHGLDSKLKLLDTSFSCLNMPIHQEIEHICHGMRMKCNLSIVAAKARIKIVSTFRSII